MALADYLPIPTSKLPAPLRGPSTKFVLEDGTPVHGMLAQYSKTPDLVHAVEAVRDAGSKVWDSFSPFPIHGIEESMGFSRTKLPYIIGVAGLSAAAMGFLLQWWISGDYPMVVQGKPFTAWQPFVPVTFEIGILITAFTTLIGMFAFNGLPRHHHPLYQSERFLSSSDDKFFVYIEATDERFDPEATRKLLEKTHPDHIELIGQRD